MINFIISIFHQVLLLLLFVITFMQFMYNYVPENPFFIVLNDAAVLWLQFMVRAMLFPIISVLCYF